LLTFSCKTRGFCPSCQAKRVEIWSEWVRETLIWDVPHRQVVFTIPKMLRILFKFKRRLLGDLSLAALRSLKPYFEAVAGESLIPGVIAVIRTFGDRINFHPHLHFLLTTGGLDEAGVFHEISRIDDGRLTELFTREVLAKAKEAVSRALEIDETLAEAHPSLAMAKEMEAAAAGAEREYKRPYRLARKRTFGSSNDRRSPG